MQDKSESRFHMCLNMSFFLFFLPFKLCLVNSYDGILNMHTVQLFSIDHHDKVAKLGVVLACKAKQSTYFL